MSKFDNMCSWTRCSCIVLPSEFLLLLSSSSLTSTRITSCALWLVQPVPQELSISKAETFIPVLEIFSGIFSFAFCGLVATNSTVAFHCINFVAFIRFQRMSLENWQCSKWGSVNKACMLTHVSLPCGLLYWELRRLADEFNWNYPSSFDSVTISTFLLPDRPIQRGRPRPDRHSGMQNPHSRETHISFLT